MTERVVLATANPDKAREIEAALADQGFDLIPRPVDLPDVDETGDTLLANARLKALALGAATGLAALADDTGLEVDALGGAPGVFSARYAGPDATYAANVAHLLGAMESARRNARTARFRTVVVLVRPDGSEVVADGVVEGVIADSPRGSGGFGYDPVFVPAGSGGRTFAEMSMTEKQQISHRGRALRALSRQLREAVPPES
ncbi:MAG: RdgB/HAM1 family non-canonical purine NTP pyrophosphatase [Acidimicrobiia bacterium]|nr:RdgB/HAM1 family non-canonical purine NTP pyrophosphatase [Acidimicrobiia bacterium]